MISKRATASKTAVVAASFRRKKYPFSPAWLYIIPFFYNKILDRPASAVLFPCFSRETSQVDRFPQKTKLDT